MEDDSLATSPMRDQDAVPLLAFVERHKLFARDIFHLEQPLGPRKRATHGVAARSSVFSESNSRSALAAGALRRLDRLAQYWPVSTTSVMAAAPFTFPFAASRRILARLLHAGFWTRLPYCPH